MKIGPSHWFLRGILQPAHLVPNLESPLAFGLAKTKLLHLLIGAAMNLVRIAVWLAEVPRARTRTSPFARLAPAYSP